MMNERLYSVLVEPPEVGGWSKKRSIEWGNEEEKPAHHPDNILNWVDLTKSPGYECCRIHDNLQGRPNSVSNCPFQASKTDFYTQLIENTLASIGIDPEKHTF